MNVSDKEYACKRANELFKRFGISFMIIKDIDNYELWIRGKLVN